VRGDLAITDDERAVLLASQSSEFGCVNQETAKANDITVHVRAAIMATMRLVQRKSGILPDLWRGHLCLREDARLEARPTYQAEMPDLLTRP
jgi:hypothetical protein